MGATHEELNDPTEKAAYRRMREPITVLVFLFRTQPDEVRFAIFRRADDHNWQSVSGGVETGETLADAARREVAEETAISMTNFLYQLDMVSGVEKSCFAASAHWSDSLYIVRKYFFAMDVTRDHAEIIISDEHAEFQWMSYDAAYAALRYDDDKTALWELNARLRRGDLPPVLG